MGETTIIGTKGERAAMKYLRSNGFLIHELNWRCGSYEIDIIAERWGVIHFVEVKTRKSGGLTTPEQAITPKKIASIRKAVASYLALKRVRGEHQYDLIAVEHDGESVVDLRYIENAMESSWMIRRR
ncbi:MAG: YraN family protein [Rikenellaceae bacterium]